MLITNEQLKSLILKNGLIDEIGFSKIEEEAKNAGYTISETLVEKDIISDENLGILISDFLKYPFIILAKITISPDVFNIIPERMARRKKVIPFAKDATGVKLAMTDPSNKELIQMISKKIGLPATTYLATEQDISNALKIYREDLQDTFDQLIKSSEIPMSKIVDLLINYASQDKASDVHIEPQEKDSLVRFRIDGILHDVLSLPKSLHDQIITRIKILSRLRTDEHLSPQDGKMRVALEDEEIDIRVSILPVTEGEKAVLRLLSSKFRKFSLVDLGMNEKDLKKVTTAYGKSYGMILSTGPTGSGKTTSIYAIVKLLNTREKNITTIEDPAEYRIKGVNQINVNTKTNLTFANGLRSILRQDPNIIFVGEIRDSETAGIAVNASLTGHLVLSTLHTNDAATALPRLIDMNVEPFLVASTVNVIIAQRLVRKICEICRSTRTITKEDLLRNLPSEIINNYIGEKTTITIYQGNGCKICNATGYLGRIGVFEVLEVTKNIRDLITKRNDADVILQKAIEEGMTTMLDDGLEKVLKGLTTIEEGLRVAKIQNK
ncbi:MAG: General secretory pathway protein E [Candidatus Levybacteria bacterium GW2011_GWC2_37_7]|nr:MAG: General secretory pathway protein E [Candidatus Levybacteria bacterium GW2011_GWC2_37_7]